METTTAKANAKKPKYHSKKVKFGSREYTMWSIDGVTWSSRKEELLEIQARHEAERLKLMQGVAERVAEERADKQDKTPEKEAASSSGEEEGPVLVTSSGDDEEAADTKSKAKKKAPSARDRVQFVAPKPREIAKAKNKPSPNKKKRAA